MPLMMGGSTDRKRIKAATTPTSKEDFLRYLVLNKKEIFVKFEEDVIVRNKAINGE